MPCLCGVWRFANAYVYFNGKEIEEMSWDNETTVETVCSLSLIK